MKTKLTLLIALLFLSIIGLGFRPHQNQAITATRTPTASPAPAPLHFRALIAQVGTGDPYPLAVYENELGAFVLDRQQAGIFLLTFDDPVLPLEPLPYLQATIYDDGAATIETVEASPQDYNSVRFTHYQQINNVLTLSDGLNGSFAVYLELVVYP